MVKLIKDRLPGALSLSKYICIIPPYDDLYPSMGLPPVIQLVLAVTSLSPTGAFDFAWESPPRDNGHQPAGLVR